MVHLKLPYVLASFISACFQESFSFNLPPQLQYNHRYHLSISSSRSQKIKGGHHHHHQHQHRQSSSILYQQYNNNNQYDMSKPTFDPLTLRTIRNDALIQYSSTNQSEPLRINLYFLLTCTLFAFPSISEAIGFQIPETIPDFVVIVTSIIGGFGSFALFLRECQARSKQLNRIEREMNAEFLDVKLPEALGGGIKSLKELGTNRQKKIIAISGSKEDVQKVLAEGQMLRRRLVQSNCLLVVLPLDISKNNERTDIASMKWEWDQNDAGIIGGRWIAEATNLSTWVEYFTGLANQKKVDNKKGDQSLQRKSDSLIWFGLNANRRSFGSGVGSSSLYFLQLMGSFLRPVVILNEDDPPDTNSDEVLVKAQAEFYKALTDGEEDMMKSVWSSSPYAKEVKDVVDSGGRIDEWKTCLMDGARPEGMLVADSDAWIKSDTEAYTTCIEFPPMAPMESGTLLAIQRWTRDNLNSPWKLDLHQTIPWTAESRASGTLLCDCRGCVALTRSIEKRTFGGVIG